MIYLISLTLILCLVFLSVYLNRALLTNVNHQVVIMLNFMARTPLIIWGCIYLNEVYCYFSLDGLISYILMCVIIFWTVHDIVRNKWNNYYWLKLPHRPLKTDNITDSLVRRAKFHSCELFAFKMCVLFLICVFHFSLA